MAVQSQDVARVVTLEEMLVVLVGDEGRILRELQQVLQPLPVLVQAEEGEVKIAAPGEEQRRSSMSTSPQLGQARFLPPREVCMNKGKRRAAWPQLFF